MCLCLRVCMYEITLLLVRVLSPRVLLKHGAVLQSVFACRVRVYAYACMCIIVCMEAYVCEYVEIACSSVVDSVTLIVWEGVV